MPAPCVGHVVAARLEDAGDGERDDRDVFGGEVGAHDAGVLAAPDDLRDGVLAGGVVTAEATQGPDL